MKKNSAKPARREAMRRALPSWLLSLFMIFICLITLYPMLNVLAVSLSSKSSVARGLVTFYPREFTLSAYKNVFRSTRIYTAYKNTLIIVLLGTPINVLLTALTAYPLSKRRLRGRSPITFFMTFTMWFGGGMIPTYLVVKATGLLDTYWAVILPGAISAYNTVIMRNFFQTIPESLEESALIDSAGDFRILFSIMLPLCKPILATITMWCAVSHWNSFFAPLIYFNDSAMYPLQVYLRDIVISTQLDKYGLLSYSEVAETAVQSESIINATIVVSMLPILMIYPFLQKYFTRGVLVGAIKG